MNINLSSITSFYLYLSKANIIQVSNRMYTFLVPSVHEFKAVVSYFIQSWMFFIIYLAIFHDFMLAVVSLEAFHDTLQFVSRKIYGGLGTIFNLGAINDNLTITLNKSTYYVPVQFSK